MKKDRTLMVDVSIQSAAEAWISHGLDPGSCVRLLLQGKYKEALAHAHPLIIPYWEDHVAYIQSLPAECRGENMEAWERKKESETTPPKE